MQLPALFTGAWLACLSVLPAAATIDASLQMQLGNPSGATADPTDHAHYLIQRAVETIDYSDNLGEPVWASWDLTSADVGSATRSSDYFVDTNLPSGFTRLSTTDYNGVGTMGFNRGHLCPSADRTDSRADNDAVFFMSNIMPQSAANNQGPWGALEDYCRTQLGSYELLILCGPSGFSGSRLPSGKVSIPSNSWKVVVFVPLGSGQAASRLRATNRVVAISIPNATNGLSSSWQTYLTSPRKIESDAGLVFFSALPQSLGEVLRARVDGTLPPGITNVQPLAGASGATVVLRGTNFVGVTDVWFNGTNASFNVSASNLITATVPAGATTGPVSVIAAGGLVTSAGVFTVTPPIPPGIQTLVQSGGQISLTITGTVAATYTIFAKTDLGEAQWTALLTTNPATLPFTFTDTNTLSQRFYRIQSR